MTLVHHDIRPSHIVTRNSIENAVASVAATGGRTNAVLHTPAIAAEFGIAWTVDDFAAVADRTPLIGDMRPGGRYAASDMYEAGGVAIVAKELLKQGLLHGEEKTVDGRTIAKIAADAVATPGPAGRPPDRDTDQAVRRLTILKGSLAPEGCVVKLAGHERRSHRGPARVFDSEHACYARGAGAPDQGGRCRRHPLRGPGRRPRHAGDAVGHGRASRARASASPSSLLTDGRFSGGTHGLMIGHVAPEAAVGGPIALVEEGDIITVDVDAKELNLEVDAATLAERRARWSPPAARYTRGVFAKYAALVSSASEGAVTSSAALQRALAARAGDRT